MESAVAVREWLRPRVRIVGSAAVVGFVLSALAVAFLVIVAQYDLRFVSTQTFSLAALCFGFGILGWSGSILVGTSVEIAQHHLDTGTNWSESDSRRAMARIIGFGAGGMTGVSIVAAVLG